MKTRFMGWRAAVGRKTAAGGAAILLVLVTGTLSAQAPPAATKAPFIRPAPAAGAVKGDEGGKRLREGMRLTDVEGRFEFTGDRMAFFRADAEESYKVLENLALERINKVLEETRASEKPRWVISGTMTEYHGGNYLLVTKAVIKAQTPVTAGRAEESHTPARRESKPPSTESKTVQP